MRWLPAVASQIYPLLGCLWIAVAAGTAEAGKYNQVLSIGDAAPQWEALPAATGDPLASRELSELPVTVVAFTCNTCPYAVDAQQRLIELDRWLRERGGRLVAINVNKVDGDRLEDMRQRARDAGFTFPYLYDESQQIAKRFGATTTPEFYVLDDQWQVAYMGALDDSPDGEQIDHQHVRAAVEAVLRGAAVERAETVPIGCRIRFERSRRGGR
jgi:peroxiredoxin